MEENFYMTNRQKLLFMVQEIHKRGYEKLRVIPSLSPSGLSWRCLFIVDTKKEEFIASNWIYKHEKEDSSKEISLTAKELADLFIGENIDFINNCKGENEEYTRWYSQMLNQLRKDELPYAFADRETEEGFWHTLKGKKIKTLPEVTTTIIKSALFGVAVGDALGVPVEFNSRETLSKNPVTDMIGYGTYNLPAGTWSDDSSLTFCLAEALTQDFDLDTIGKNLVKWYHKNFWIARGNVFDVGVTTRHAISRLANGEKPELAGSSNESESGNGSLMRMIPLLFYLFDKPINERYDITKQVSSLTHRQIRSVNACFYYLEFARQIFYGKDKFGIYRNLQTEVPNYLTSLSINPREIELFDRLLKSDIHNFYRDQIQSSGYVIHTRNGLKEILNDIIMMGLDYGL